MVWCYTLYCTFLTVKASLPEMVTFWRTRSPKLMVTNMLSPCRYVTLAHPVKEIFHKNHCSVRLNQAARAQLIIFSVDGQPHQFSFYQSYFRTDFFPRARTWSFNNRDPKVSAAAADIWRAVAVLLFGWFGWLCCLLGCLGRLCCLRRWLSGRRLLPCWRRLHFQGSSILNQPHRRI